MLKTKNLKKKKPKPKITCATRKNIYIEYISKDIRIKILKFNKKNTQNICEKRMYAQRKAQHSIIYIQCFD